MESAGESVRTGDKAEIACNFSGNSNVPWFYARQTFAESIAGLEQLVNEYFVVTSKKFDEDVLLGVLLRCSPQSLRQRLTLTMTRETTYRQARELILGYERSAKTWDVQSVLKQFQASSSHDAQGPTLWWRKAGTKAEKTKDVAEVLAMARVLEQAGQLGIQAKGQDESFSRKGKDKGKSQGKKGKKGKGKQMQKGKGKRLETDVCRICGGYGHWGNECPRNPRAREVAQSDQAPGPQQQAHQQGNGDAPTVRQVRMYHVATPPEPGETEYFEMASEGDGDWVCAVTASGTEHFWIGVCRRVSGR